MRDGQQSKKAMNPFQLNFKIWELTLCTHLSDAFVLYALHGTICSKLLGFETPMVPFLLLLFGYADG